jgi:hypothetical protein
MADPTGPRPGVSPPRVSSPYAGYSRTLLIVVLLIVTCVGGSTLEAVRYQGMPNVFTLGSITYIPPRGPANPLLLASRPERIYQRYLDDYIHLAGTFPCVENLGLPYFDFFTDPVLDGKTCPVTRPVASYTITRVTIRDHGLFKVSDALVHVTVTYVNGARWDYDQVLIPDEYQNAWAVFWTHLDCWSFLGGLLLFGRLVPDIPAGAAYSVTLQSNAVCKH